MIRSEDIRDRVRDIDEYLLKKYKESRKNEKRDWRTYEQKLIIGFLAHLFISLIRYEIKELKTIRTKFRKTALVNLTSLP